MAVNAEQNQQYNQEQNANPQTQAPTTGGGAAQTNGNQAPSANNSSRVANYSSGQQAGSTGSGRFTNLQKYISANEGAGDRLGAGIEDKVSRVNQGAEKEADTSASAVRQGIQDAQGKLATGDQYKQQVSSDNFNAQDIAGDANKLQDFTNYRTGSAIDEAALAKQNQAAQDAANAYQTQMQNQLGQTQTDNGRYGLLKQAFGGGSVYQNPYSQGQQRLDQLFLQSGGDNKIGQLQNQLRTGLTNNGQLQNQLTGQVTNDVNDITTNEAAQSKAIQDAVTGKTNDFVSGIEASANDVNAARQAKIDWANQQYDNLQNNKAIDPEFASLLGLTNGQHLYTGLAGNNVNSYLNYGVANLQGANQLANDQQRAQYAALAQVAGITDPQITAGGSPADVITKNTSSLDNLYNTIQQQGNGLASQTGIADDSRGGHSEISVQQLQNLLQQSGINSLDQLGNVQDPNNPIYNQFSQYSSYDGTPQAIGAKRYAVQDALMRMRDAGYFNQVNIAPPSDIEKMPVIK